VAIVAAVSSVCSFVIIVNMQGKTNRENGNLEEKQLHFRHKSEK
jgi:hypothetical protein